MDTHERRQTAAWLFLFSATLLSLWSVAHVGMQNAAIGASMAIAAAKVIVVLRRFMDSDRLSTPLKVYFYVWPLGCAAMILGIACFS